MRRTFALLCVSATQSNDSLASFTNTGNNIDVAAPGVGIRTTVKGGSYGSVSGTSFSAPITAGVAALILAANPGLTGQQAFSIIRESADDLGPSGWDPGYGYGRVNAANAVMMALGYTGDTIAPTVNFAAPTSGASLSGTTSVQVNATDNVGVTRVRLFLNGSLTATLNSAPFQYALNTTLFSNGSYVLRAECRGRGRQHDERGDPSHVQQHLRHDAANHRDHQPRKRSNGQRPNQCDIQCKRRHGRNNGATVCQRIVEQDCHCSAIYHQMEHQARRKRPRNAGSTRL